jgi:hypothetical protein
MLTLSGRRSKVLLRFVHFTERHTLCMIPCLSQLSRMSSLQDGCWCFRNDWYPERTCVCVYAARFVLSEAKALINDMIQEVPCNEPAAPFSHFIFTFKKCQSIVKWNTSNLIWESHETYKYSLWAEIPVSYVKGGDACRLSNHCVSRVNAQSLICFSVGFLCNVNLFV